MFYGLTEAAMEPTGSSFAQSHFKIHPPNPELSAAKSVVDLCNTNLGVKVKLTDLAYAYRVPSKASITCRPIIVRFLNQRTRNAILSARKVLKNVATMNRVFINEHLTRTNSLIFAKARQLVKSKSLHSAWTRGGVTFVRQLEDPADKPKRITSLENLEKIAS